MGAFTDCLRWSCIGRNLWGLMTDRISFIVHPEYPVACRVYRERLVDNKVVDYEDLGEQNLRDAQTRYPDGVICNCSTCSKLGKL